MEVARGTSEMSVASDSICVTTDEEHMDVHDDFEDIGTEADPGPDAPQEVPDRVAATLRVIAGGLLVVVLVAAISFALYLQTLGAPRSAAERDIERYRAAVAEQPELLGNYVKLAYAYAIAGRYDDATETITIAEQMTKAPAIEVQLARAEIERAAGRAEDAIATYDKVVKMAEDEYAAQAEELKRQQIVFQPPNSTLAAALKGRGMAKWDAGDQAGAIADLDAALNIEPTDAATMVVIGGYYAESGDTSTAAAAYRRALRFVPDYPEALAGLRALGMGE